MRSRPAVRAQGGAQLLRQSPQLQPGHHSSSLFLSVVTVVEIEGGIAKLRREGARRKSSHLASWLETVLHLYGDRVLVFDAPVARIAGAISDRASAHTLPEPVWWDERLYGR